MHKQSSISAAVSRETRRQLLWAECLAIEAKNRCPGLGTAMKINKSRSFPQVSSHSMTHIIRQGGPSPFKILEAKWDICQNLLLIAQDLTIGRLNSILRRMNRIEQSKLILNTILD
jgi:hypothetical protein